MNLLRLQDFNLRARSVVINDLRLEAKGSRFEFNCYLYAEVSTLQQSPG